MFEIAATEQEGDPYNSHSLIVIVDEETQWFEHWFLNKRIHGIHISYGDSCGKTQWLYGIDIVTLRERPINQFNI